MSIKEITLARGTIQPHELNLAKILKAKGYKVNSISIYGPSDEEKLLFNNCYYLLEKKHKQKQSSKMGKFHTVALIVNKLPSLWKSKKLINNVIIGISEPNVFISFVFWLHKKTSLCRIYFPYDITYFRYRKRSKISWLERIAEKKNFKNCGGIIHKGPKNELQELPENFNAGKKPQLQFLPYCNINNFIAIDEKYKAEKHSKKDGKIHLVYVGGVYPSASFKNMPSTAEMFKKIVQQKMFIDIYPLNYDQIINRVDYKELQKSKYFTIHKPIFGKQLIEDIKRYDWGLYIFYITPDVFKKELSELAFGSKVATYLEAGLPIITNKELKFVASIIKKKRFGIVINDIQNLEKKIKMIHHDTLIKKMDEERKKFTMFKNMPRFTQFIKRVVEHAA